MPKKLIVLLVLMGTGILFRILSMATMSGTIPGAEFVGLAVNIALFVGILKGNEGVRTIIIGFAVLGLIIGSFALLRANALGLKASNPILMLAVLLSVVSPAYTIWCLTRSDVKNWMMRKTFKMA